jgi:flagellin
MHGIGIFHLEGKASANYNTKTLNNQKINQNTQVLLTNDRTAIEDLSSLGVHVGLKISGHSTVDQLKMNLRRTEARGAKVLSQLSSGKRITSAGDDAAGLAIATNLNAQVRSLRQATRNANDGISSVQTAEGGLEEISNILVRLRELSIQSASDTGSDNEREFLNLEYGGLLAEIDRISESTSFNGTNVINGEEGELNFQIGAFATEESTIVFDTENAHVDTSELAISSSSIDTKADALDNLESLDEAIMTVNGQRAQLGATQSRLQYATNNLETSVLNQDVARSRIEDVDIASSTAELAAARVSGEMAIKSINISNRSLNKIIKLIQS